MYQNYEKARDALGYTNYRVAKETGLNEGVFSAWKTGRTKPNVDSLIKIADVLGVTIDELVREREETA